MSEQLPFEPDTTYGKDGVPTDVTDPAIRAWMSSPEVDKPQIATATDDDPCLDMVAREFEANRHDRPHTTIFSPPSLDDASTNELVSLVLATESARKANEGSRLKKWVNLPAWQSLVAIVRERFGLELKGAVEIRMFQGRLAGLGRQFDAAGYWPISSLVNRLRPSDLDATIKLIGGKSRDTIALLKYLDGRPDKKATLEEIARDIDGVKGLISNQIKKRIRTRCDRARSTLDDKAAPLRLVLFEMETFQLRRKEGTKQM